MSWPRSTFSSGLENDRGGLGSKISIYRTLTVGSRRSPHLRLFLVYRFWGRAFYDQNKKFVNLSLTLDTMFY